MKEYSTKGRTLVLINSEIKEIYFSELMNYAKIANEDNMIIDIIIIGDKRKNTKILLQIANKTKGLLINLEDKINDGLLEYFSQGFMIDNELRNELWLPYLNKDVMTVVCKCHNKKLENLKGYLCTNCLSLYCNQYMKEKFPECIFCNCKLNYN